MRKRERDRWGRDGTEGGGLGESIEGVGLARWDSPVTARGQLARTGQSDEKGSGGRESEGRGSGGGSDKEMKEREGAGSSDNLRVSFLPIAEGIDFSLVEATSAIN